MIDTGRVKAFAYLTAEKAPLYRAIMRVFIDSAERFLFHLRPHEVLNVIQSDRETPEQTEIDSALSQLCEWGNLQTHPDTTDVSTVEDFYKQRYVFQMTTQGEAAEKAQALFQTISERQGELQAHGLAEIQDVLHELKELSRMEEPDPGKVHRSLITLRMCSEDLTSRAQTFMRSFQRQIDLRSGSADQFTSETQRLIDYVEQFVGGLVLAADAIGQTIRDIEAAGLDRLLQAAAKNSLADAMEANPENLDQSLAVWRLSWNRFKDWFVSRIDRPSNADMLRERARTSIPALLSIITSINDRRINRIDRSNDLRTLSRWFAQAASDADAHRLWRALFGLSPARHLLINEATLDEHDAEAVAPDTSWFDAPPLRLSTRMRERGTNSRTGRLSRIVDRTAEKKELAAATHNEALSILNAQARFGTGGRIRLSELQQLDTGEFDLFLDLVGEAVSAEVSPGDIVEISSGNGCFRVKLEPTGDETEAFINTPDGIFSGPDHWISVERNSVEEVLP